MISLPGVRQETPEQRLDRLILQRVMHVQEHGLGMFCYLCKQLVDAPQFNGTHAWFGCAGDIYNDHVAECYEARQ